VIFEKKKGELQNGGRKEKKIYQGRLSPGESRWCLQGGLVLRGGKQRKGGGKKKRFSYEKKFEGVNKAEKENTTKRRTKRDQRNR